jgi:hypothetical protein
MPKNKNSLIGALLIVGLVGGVMVGAYVMSTPDALRVPEDLRKARESGKKETKADEVLVLTPRRGADRQLMFERQKVQVPPGLDARVFAVNEYLRIAKITEADARCLGIDLQNGVAHLSFNRAFLGGQGSDDEATLINGILATMSQFQGVESVQFEVDGKPVDTLGGHFDLSTPQPVIRLTDQ